MLEFSTPDLKHHSLKEGNLGDIRLMVHKIYLIEPEMLHSKLAVQIHVVCLLLNFFLVLDFMLSFC